MSQPAGPAPLTAWQSQVAVDLDRDVVERIGALGAPTDDPGVDAEEQTGRIVCLAEVAEGNVRGLVVCPSGLAYRFEPESLARAFWSFAARHYYLVTGNMHDRRLVAEMLGLQVAEIKGKTLSRKKVDAPSGLRLDDLVAAFATEQEPPHQASLFGRP